MDEIHLFSGLGSSIFPGLRRGTRALETMIDGLPANAEHHIWNQHPKVAQGIVDRSIRLGIRPGRVVLIGHSNGVLACAEVAAYLNRFSIQVDFIGAIDPTAAKFPAVNNAKKVDEFWASSGWPALMRRFSKNRSGAVQYGPGFSGEKRLYFVKASHVGSASDPMVRKTIMASVREVLA